MVLRPPPEFKDAENYSAITSTESVDVLDSEHSVVLVATVGCLGRRIGVEGRTVALSNVGVVDKTVAGLESDLGLEGLLTNCTNHL